MDHALASTESIDEMMLGSNFSPVTILINSRDFVALGSSSVDVIHHQVIEVVAVQAISIATIKVNIHPISTDQAVKRPSVLALEGALQVEDCFVKTITVAATAVAAISVPRVPVVDIARTPVATSEVVNEDDPIDHDVAGQVRVVVPRANRTAAHIQREAVIRISKEAIVPAIVVLAIAISIATVVIVVAAIPVAWASVLLAIDLTCDRAFVEVWNLKPARILAATAT